MCEVDIVGWKWFTDEEFCKRSAAREFDKDKIIGHLINSIPYIDWLCQMPNRKLLKWRDIGSAVENTLS
jgi:hypothetical protein